jgi:hypothetical protein
LEELPALVDMPGCASGNHKALAEIVGLCGCFLTLREHAITLIHQSAKDFLLKLAHDEIFPSGIEDIHRTIFSQSLRIPPMFKQPILCDIGSILIRIIVTYMFRRFLRSLANASSRVTSTFGSGQRFS